MSMCSIDGCERRVYATNWCRHHYDSVHIYGDPSAMRFRGNYVEPVVCDCVTSTPERIPMFDAWQCSTCYRKCEAP